MTSRARHLEYLNTYDARAVRQAIDGMLIRKRMSILDLLSDEDVAELTDRMVSAARSAQHRTIENRKMYAHAVGGRR